jgi:hypothetical protein
MDPCVKLIPELRRQGAEVRQGGSHWVVRRDGVVVAVLGFSLKPGTWHRTRSRLLRAGFRV